MLIHDPKKKRAPLDAQIAPRLELRKALLAHRADERAEPRLFVRRGIQAGIEHVARNFERTVGAVGGVLRRGEQ